MGVLNITPDSFSDGGCFIDVDRALSHARRMVAEGADLIDVGAESTRPGGVPISSTVETERLLPVISELCRTAPVPISVDTYKAPVAAAALAAGAHMINDISGLAADSRMGAVVARAGVPLVLMHRRPFHRPYRGDVWQDVLGGLREGLRRAEAAGIPRQRVIVDPGFGFGKTTSQNLQLIREAHRLRELGCPVLIGPSRKSSIGKVLDTAVDERLEGTAALVALAIGAGVDIIRVHDVLAMKRVAQMADAAVRGWRAAPPGEKR